MTFFRIGGCKMSFFHTSMFNASVVINSLIAKVVMTQNCSVNQLTGFYMMPTLVFHMLIYVTAVIFLINHFFRVIKSLQFSPVDKKTYTKFLKDVLSRQARHLAKTSRCTKDVSNANLKIVFVRHLEEIFARYAVVVSHKF